MTKISLDLSAAPNTELYRTVSSEKKYEPEVFDLLISLLERKGSTAFINIGSNIGLFALAAAKLRDLSKPDLLVCAHEPLPMLQDCARSLMIANGAEYRLCFEAIGGEAGTAAFYVSARSDASNSLKQGFRPAKEVITVKVETLDRLYLDLGRQFENLVLMIDVETAEPEVLGGAVQILELLRPLIICEVLAGRTEQSLSAIFAQHRYEGYRFNSEHWLHHRAITGDKSYQHRDWFFCPAEKLEQFGAHFRANPTVQIELRV
jgi:FkbM family methyltransferase